MAGNEVPTGSGFEKDLLWGWGAQMLGSARGAGEPKEECSNRSDSSGVSWDL